MGDKTIPFTTGEGIRRSIGLRSASVVKPLILMRKVVQRGNVVVLDESNPLTRNTQYGTMKKLDVNCAVLSL